MVSLQGNVLFTSNGDQKRTSCHLFPYSSFNVTSENLQVHQDCFLVDDFFYSHHLSSCHCIKVVRRF